MASKRMRYTAPAETSDQPPASDDPNPTSALPSAPPTTDASTTQPVLSVPIPSPSSALPIATNQLPPPVPLLSIQETHQEHISDTSVGTGTIADSAGPSTAPSASAASTSTQRELLPIADEFLFRLLPPFISVMLAIQRLREIVPDATGSRPARTDLALLNFLQVASKEMEAVLDYMTVLTYALRELSTQVYEKMGWNIESGDSCSGSEREGGGPDSGSGGGDGQGGGVCV